MTRLTRLRYRLHDLSGPSGLLSLLIAVLLVASCADRVARHARYGSVDYSAYDRKVGTVTHVADGDTIEVDFGDDHPPVRIRLLGIDAPELDSPFGAAAKQYVQSRCDGTRVTVRLDALQGDRDKYGRMLAYVYLANHELLNNAIVRDGHAFAYRPKPCDFSSQFESSESRARSTKRGLWKSINFDQMPAWRQSWMRERNLK